MKSIPLFLIVVIGVLSCKNSSDSDKSQSNQSQSLERSRFAGAIKGLNPQDKASGFLLGLGEMRTLYIKYADGKAEVIDLPFIATPQEKFYFISSLPFHSTSCHYQIEEDTTTDLVYDVKDWNELFITSNIKDHLRKVDSLNKERSKTITSDSCTGDSWDSEEGIDILYIVNGNICLMNSYGGYQGGAHPNYSQKTNTYKFPSEGVYSSDSKFKESGLKDFFKESEIANLDEDLEKVLKIKIANQIFVDGEISDEPRFYKKELEKYKDKPEKAEQSDDRMAGTEIYSRELILYRNNGKVFLNKEADVSGPYVSTGDYEYSAETVAGPLDKPSIYNTIPLKFEDFKKIDSNVVDVFVSPTEDVVFILTKEELIGVDVKTLNEVFTYKISKPEVIMAEWAIGNYADKWKDALTIR